MENTLKIAVQLRFTIQWEGEIRSVWGIHFPSKNSPISGWGAGHGATNGVSQLPRLWQRAVPAVKVRGEAGTESEMCQDVPKPRKADEHRLPLVGGDWNMDLDNDFMIPFFLGIYWG